MSRVAKKIDCTSNDIKTLNNIINNGLSPKDLIVRCESILLANEGMKSKDIAKKLGVRPNSVGDWRKAWLSGGVDALINIVRTGRPRSDKRREVELELQSATTATASSISNGTGASKSTVYRAMAERGTGCAGLDVALYTETRMVNIVGMYISGSEKAIVLRTGSSDISLPDGRLALPSADVPEKIKSRLNEDSQIELCDALRLLSETDIPHPSGKSRHGMKTFLLGLVPELPKEADDHYHVIYFTPSGREGIGNITRCNLHTEECDSAGAWIRETGFWIELLGGDSCAAQSTTSAIKTYLESCNDDTAPFQWHRYNLRNVDVPQSADPLFDGDGTIESIVTVTATIVNRDGTTATANVRKINAVPAAGSMDYSDPVSLGSSAGDLDVSLGGVFRDTQKMLMENYMNEAVKKTPRM